MRAVIIASGLLILIIIMAVLSVWFTGNTAVTVNTQTDELMQAVEADDWEGATQKVEQMEQAWEKARSKFAVLFPHTELDQIETSFSKLPVYVKEQSKTEALAELLVVKMFIQHLIQKDKLLLENLF